MKDKERIDRLELLVVSLTTNLAVLFDAVAGEAKVPAKELGKAIKRDLSKAKEIIGIKDETN